LEPRGPINILSNITPVHNNQQQFQLHRARLQLRRTNCH